MSQISSPPAGKVLPAGHWVLLPGSVAEFSVRNFALKKVTGRVPLLRAEVDVDDLGRIAAVTAVGDLTGIDTGNARRDKHLAEPNLLDSKQFPTLQFTGEGGPGGGDVHGRLTADRGVAEVVLAYQLEAEGPQRLSVQASTSFDRTAIGMKAPRMLIGRWIGVELRATFERAGSLS